MPEPQSENIDLIALTRALVDIDSTSGREGAVASVLSRYLSEQDFAVTEQRVDEHRDRKSTRLNSSH